MQDSLSDSELEIFEPKIDALAAIFVQPIIGELTFDDFYADPKNEDEQRRFFSKARSSISVENIPFLESNPFQVSYLKLLLNKFGEVLIDRGGVQELMLKKDFLNLIGPLNSMDSILMDRPELVEAPRKAFYPVDPLDFIFVDVIKEIERIKREGKSIDASTLGPHPTQILRALEKDFDHPLDLFKASGLGAKAFDDGLERLKFFLRSV